MKRNKPAWNVIRIVMMHALLDFEGKFSNKTLQELDTFAESLLIMSISELEDELIKRGFPINKEYQNDTN